MTGSSPYERVVFDCDSTLSRIEGIDELAVEKREEVALLTRRAMEGELSLGEVYGQRLELIAPTKKDLEQLGQAYIVQAVPDVRELIGALRFLGKEICILSGGLRPAVVKFAEWLGIDEKNVHCVDLCFDERGHYKDFDRESPLSQQDGKRRVIRRLAPKKTAFVGDGSTDLEAKDVVATFIYYGGVVLRPKVAAKADVVVEEESFAALLPILCDHGEIERLLKDHHQKAFVEKAGLSR